MKNKLIFIIVCIVLIILLIFGTYVWYLYFLRYSQNTSTNSNNNSTIKVGDIELKEDSKPLYDADAKSIEDIEIDTVPSYDFRIINNGDKENAYTLLIEDIPANLVDDGCAEDNLLKRTDLKYQLTMNGIIIKEDYLSNIKDNILDTRKLEAKKTNIYSIKIYIHESAKDWIGKHYHYKVVLEK